MHAVEEGQQRLIAHFLRVEDDLQSLGVACAPRADGAVGRIGSVAADVSDFGVDEAFVGESLAEEVLHAPEAAGGYGAFLAVLRDGDRGAVAGVEGHGR